MLQDVVHPPPPEQLPTESFQILDFCDQVELFAEIGGGGGDGTGDVVAVSGAGSGGTGICAFDDCAFPSDDLSPYSVDASALSTLLDSELPSDPEPDIIHTADYTSAPLQPPPATTFPLTTILSNPQDELDELSFSEMSTVDGFASFLPETLLPLPPAGRSVPPPPHSLPSVIADECMSSLSGYMGLEPSSSSTSCSFMDATHLGGAFFPGAYTLPAAEEGLAGLFTRPRAAATTETTIPAAPEMGFEYRGDQNNGRAGGGIGFYGLDNTGHPRIYATPADMQRQALGDPQQLVNGCGSPSPALAADMPQLEESAFKVGRLSVEERKERIHRYMKKRNERNFSKKIKYACRKTLADSRPRVRGRFAKNDEFGESGRAATSVHEDEEEEVASKEEEDMYAHLSSVPSFKCNYGALESLI